MPERAADETATPTKAGTKDKDDKNKPQSVKAFVDIDDYAELKKEALSLGLPKDRKFDGDA